LYGLAVESPIALMCPRADPGTPPDVTLSEGEAIAFARARQVLELSSTPSQWFECGTLPDSTTYMCWQGLFDFLVSHDGRVIHFRRFRKASRESFTTYLLGQVLSFSLLSFGVEPLHATAIVVDGRAIAFLGGCGLGKSTLGAAFLARGFPVLTDDLLALERRERGWLAHPGPPRLKLFPLVAETLLKGKSHGSSLNPLTSKRILRLTPAEATACPAPLHALYVLTKPRTASRATARISPLRTERAFFELIRGSFNLIQVDRRRLENQFRIATGLAAEVPVRRLSYPRKLSGISLLCASILADVDALSAVHEDRTSTA
jgi:hypothetical protein